MDSFILKRFSYDFCKFELFKLADEKHIQETGK